MLLKISVPRSQTTACTSKGAYVKRALNSRGEAEIFAMDVDAIISTVGRIGTRNLTAQTFTGLTIKDIDLKLVKRVAEEIRRTSILESDIHIFSQDPLDILKNFGFD